MGGSSSKKDSGYVISDKTIVFTDKGAVTCQIHSSKHFPEFNFGVTPQYIFDNTPDASLIVITYKGTDIESITHYLDRKKHGRRTEYKDAKIFREMNYDQDKLEGMFIENGDETTLCEYKNGLKHGKETIRYGNGNVKSVKHYRDGKLHGECVENYLDGKPKTIAWYRDDSYNGPVEYYHENKNIHIQSNYKFGKLDGEYIVANQAGYLTKKCTYKDGNIDGKYIEYDDQKTLFERTYKNGILHGLARVYNNRQILMKCTNYKDGKEDGEHKEFYEDGKLKYQVGYIGGLRNGKYVQYYENGQIEMVGNFDRDMWDGTTEYYDEIGNHIKTHIYRHAALITGIYYAKSALDAMIYNTSKVGNLVYSGGTPCFDNRPDKYMRPQFLEYQMVEQKLDDIPPPKYTEPNTIMTFMRQISKEAPPPQYIEPSAPPLPLAFPQIPHNEEVEEGNVKKAIVLE